MPAQAATLIASNAVAVKRCADSQIFNVVLNGADSNLFGVSAEEDGLLGRNPVGKSVANLSPNRCRARVPIVRTAYWRRMDALAKVRPAPRKISMSQR